MLDDNSFFSDMESLIQQNRPDVFKTNTKTILGKNIVLNFLGEIEFEIRSVGFSNVANEIAEFYEKCKKSGGIISFFNNPVVKMILVEIQHMPTVKSYLKTRIFDDIEREKVEVLNQTFKDNDKIREEQQVLKQDFVKKKVLYEREIGKIMKKYGCDRQEAEEKYKKFLLQQKTNKIEKELNKQFESYLNNLAPTGMVKVVNTNQSTENNNNNTNTEIILDDNVTLEDNNDDGFWQL